MVLENSHKKRTIQDIISDRVEAKPYIRASYSRPTLIAARFESNPVNFTMQKPTLIQKLMPKSQAPIEKPVITAEQPLAAKGFAGFSRSPKLAKFF